MCTVATGPAQPTALTVRTAPPWTVTAAVLPSSFPPEAQPVLCALHAGEIDASSDQQRNEALRDARAIVVGFGQDAVCPPAQLSGSGVKVTKPQSLAV
jgi:hypothetical protein